MKRPRNERLRRSSSRPAPQARPPEAAQLVWQRALELAGPRAVHDRFYNALDLLRAAHHDPATMAHALTIGLGELRGDDGRGGGDDAVALNAAKILQEAIVFLGVKPRTGDVGRQIRAGQHAGPRP